MLVLVLVIDFWSAMGLSAAFKTLRYCFADVDHRTFIRFQRAKIDDDHENDWRQNEEHWDAAKQSLPHRGEVRAAEAKAGLICRGMSARFSFVDVPGAGLSDERTAGQRCGLAESDIWHFARFARQWEIFSKRIIWISFPHQDPPKIWVTGEANPHHVVHFTLMPVGGGPEVKDSRDLQMILRDAGFQSEVNVGLQGVKLVDHLKPRFIPEIIDAGKVSEKIEAELLLGKFTGWLDLPESQFQE